jgi:hypothetical protein
MPELVKIGSTTINPHDRAKQLYTTGVPAPFKVYGYVRVQDHEKIEKAVHRELSRFRKSNDREFFKIAPEEAVKILESVSGQYEVKRRQEAEKAELAAKRKLEEEARRIKAEKESEQLRLREEQRKLRDLEVKTRTIDIPSKWYWKFDVPFRVLTYATFLIGFLLLRFGMDAQAGIAGLAWASFWMMSRILAKIRTKYEPEGKRLRICALCEQPFPLTGFGHAQEESTIRFPDGYPYCDAPTTVRCPHCAYEEDL